ncbi:phosphoribosylanthranilate isomerase [Thermoproteota archaeon]
MTVFVKICGIKSRAALDAAVSAGADAVGFVVGVPSSQRNLSLDKARELRVSIPGNVSPVLVMVPKTLHDVLQAVEYINPDMVQLHDVRFDTIEISTPIIRGVNNRTPIEEAHLIAKKCDSLLLDSYKEGTHGGTGTPQDLAYSKYFIEQLTPHPVILAGGMRPDNVANAIQIANPYGVDASSGVESSPGVKDPEKIRAFVEAAKNT